MKSKNIFFVLIAFAAFAFSACQKQVDNLPALAKPIAPRLSKITYENNNVSYLYNIDGTLKEEIIRDNNGTQTGRYEYTHENGNVKEARSGNIKLVYSYPNTATIQVELKSITGVTSHSSEYKFDGRHLLEWTEYTYGSGIKQPDHKVVHTYNNAGNIVKSEYYEHAGTAWMRYETVDVQYDNKMNYTSHVDDIPYHLGQIRILSNHPVKEEYRGINGNIFKTVVYQHSFNAQGRKIRSEVKTLEDGLPAQTETIVYEY